MKISRRKALATIGASAVAVGGVATFASNNAAALNTSITASNPATVSNDRGDLTEVTADPQFRVEWEGMDQAVGAVFCAMEARVNGGEYRPVFRMTPWLATTEQFRTLDGTSRSLPSTSGHYEITTALSGVLNQSRYVRGNDGHPIFENGRPIRLLDERGFPSESEATAASGVDGGSYDQWVIGNSIGSTPDDLVTGALDGATGEDDPGDSPLALPNHFPGAQAGSYPAADVAPDTDTDDSTETNVVDIRYTFELLRPSVGQVVLLADGLSVSDLEGMSESEVRQAIDESDVLDDRDVFQDVVLDDVVVRTDFGGTGLDSWEAYQHVAPMDGEDGYPSVGDYSMPGYDTFPATTRAPGILQQAGSDGHPAIVVEEASFEVTVDNEPADSGATGESNTGAS